MQRKPWVTETNKIMEAIRALIIGQFPVTLQRQDDRPLQTRLLAIHLHRQTPYLLIARPPELSNPYQVRDLLFKLKGLPILGFSCPVTRASDSILATMLPCTMFALELRQGGRIGSLPGSMATFFIHGRSLVNICWLENISLGGVKLFGQPAHAIDLHDIVGPCTLSLAGQDATVSREVTINQSAVVRVEPQGEQQGFGLKFDLNDSEESQLRGHLDFLSKHK